MADDPGNYFQSEAALTTLDRKARKSSNNKGRPIRLPSKILAVIADPQDERRVYVAESAGCARRVTLSMGTGDGDDDDDGKIESDLKALNRVHPVYRGPAAPLTSLAISFSPASLEDPAQGKRGVLFAGCWDKHIYSWDIVSRGVLRKYAGHTDFVKTVHVIPASTSENGADRRPALLVSAGADGVVILWDIDTGRQLWKEKCGVSVQTLAVDPLSLSLLQGEDDEVDDDGLVLFAGTSDPRILRWRIRYVASSSAELSQPSVNANALPPIVSHDTSVYALYFSTDSEASELWTASADKTARCLVRERGWAEDTVLAHPDFVRDVVVDERGGWVVTACRDEGVRVWEKGSGKLWHVFEGHYEEVTGLALLPGPLGSGSTLVSVSIDGTVRQWPLAREELAATKERALKEAAGEVEEKVPERKEGMLTEDEERELAELMED